MSHVRDDVQVIQRYQIDLIFGMRFIYNIMLNVPVFERFLRVEHVKIAVTFGTGHVTHESVWLLFCREI
jgi:hypothetical protein